MRGELSITGVSIKDIYETKKFEKLIPIANRPNNHLKIIKTDAL
jgi:hypothetical protein